MTNLYENEGALAPSNVEIEELDARNTDIDALIEKLKTFDLDDYTHRILYKASSTVIALISFTPSEKNEKIYLRGSSGYIAWMSGGTIEGAKLYTGFSADSFGTASTPSQNTSAYYFSGTYCKVYSAKVENIYYSNVDIYDKNQENLIYKADPTLWLGDDDVIISGITHEPHYVGDTETTFSANVSLGANQEVKEIRYEPLDVKLPFERYGNYKVRVTVATVSGIEVSEVFPFSVYPDRAIPYPTDTPMPPEDGHTDVVILGDGDTRYCATFDYIAQPTAFYLEAGKLAGALNKGICVNSSLYLLNTFTTQWEEASPGTYDYHNRIHNYFTMKVEGAVLYSTVDIHSSNTLEEIIYESQPSIPREKYNAKTMQVSPPLDYTDPLLFDASIEGYMIMREGKGYDTLYAFCVRAKEAGAPLDVTFTYSTKITVDNDLELLILRRTASETDWTEYRKWGAYTYHTLASRAGNLYYLLYEIHNLNLYIASENRTNTRLLYESERVRQALPAIITLADGSYRLAEDVSSHMKLFDGKTWKGVELTDVETGVAIYDGTQWLNIGLFSKEEE